MYRCKPCDVHVEPEARAAHSATDAHRANGGSPEVDEDDYEPLPGTRGTSKTR